MLQEVFLREFKQLLAWEGKQCSTSTKREKWEVHCALHVSFSCWSITCCPGVLEKNSSTAVCTANPILSAGQPGWKNMIWAVRGPGKKPGQGWSSAKECPAPSVLPAAGAGLQSALRNSWNSYPQSAVKRLQMTMKHFVFQKMSITGILQKYFSGTKTIQTYKLIALTAFHAMNTRGYCSLPSLLSRRQSEDTFILLWASLGISVETLNITVPRNLPGLCSEVCFGSKGTRKVIHFPRTYQNTHHRFPCSWTCSESQPHLLSFAQVWNLRELLSACQRVSFCFNLVGFPASSTCRKTLLASSLLFP